MSFRKNFLFTLCAVCVYCFAVAQKSDSLLIKLYQEPNDSSRVQILLKIATHYDQVEHNNVLAENYRLLIIQNVQEHREATSLTTILKEVGLALLVILFFSILIYFATKLFKWTAKKIEFNEDKVIKGIKLNNYTLFDAKRQVRALLVVNKIVKWIFVLLLI